MKNILTFIILLLAFINLPAQDLTEGRLAYSNTGSFITTEIINTLDPDDLTPKEDKKHIEWLKQLNMRVMDVAIDKSSSFFAKKGLEVLPTDAVAPFGMMAVSTDGYPGIVFPKKAIKKKGADLDIAEYYLSLSTIISKPTKLSNPLKGYQPEIDVVIKMYDNTGQEIAKIKKMVTKEGRIGVFKGEKIFFSKIDYDSLDTFMELFGADIGKAVDETLMELSF